jgi:predicted nucleic acid-binding protein
MPVALVDSCVINDLCLPNSDWHAWSADTLSAMDEDYTLVINPIVFAECSVSIATLEETDALFEQLQLELLTIPRDALFLAGKAFLAYRRRGGVKKTILPDFLIGAHAAVEGMRLITRDRSGFASYFPTLRLVTP